MKSLLLSLATIFVVPFAYGQACPNGICPDVFAVEFTDFNDLKCIDLRKTLFAPCEEGLSRYFDKGSCTNASEVEHAYCAKYEMTKIQKVRGEIVIPWEAIDGRVQAFITSTGNLIVANENVIHNCKDATILFGQSKEANDNYNPLKGEIGIADELIRFECHD